jgi:hypothetical protein
MFVNLPTLENSHTILEDYLDDLFYRQVNEVAKMKKYFENENIC